MLSLFLDPVALLLILWAVAGQNAQLEYTTLFYVALGYTLGRLVINAALTSHIGKFTVVPTAALAI